MTANGALHSGRGLTHQGLLYASDEEFLATTVPFCRDGLAEGDAVLAVTTEANIGLLRQALADAADHVDFVNADDWYHKPGTTLGAYYRYVDRYTSTGRHRQVRVIGEPVWHGRDALETAEWTRYESAINVAFAECPAWIICPYDSRSLPPSVIADARRTHPELAAPAAARPSEHYADPATADSFWQRPLSLVQAQGEEAVLSFGAELAGVRAFVADTATELGASKDTTQRLVLAVNEVATNAVQHGDGGGQVIMRRCGSRIVTDIINPGEAATAWYIGYLPPDLLQPHGHGMWAVRHLCDLMEAHTGHGTTTVRLHMTLG